MDLSGLTISAKQFRDAFEAGPKIPKVFPNSGDYLLRLSQILSGKTNLKERLEKMAAETGAINPADLAEFFQDVDKMTSVGYPNKDATPQQIAKAILAGIQVYRDLETQKTTLGADLERLREGAKAPAPTCGKLQQDLDKMKQAADETSKQLVACRGEKAQGATSVPPVPAAKPAEQQAAAASTAPPAAVVPAKQIPEEEETKAESAFRDKMQQSYNQYINPKGAKPGTAADAFWKNLEEWSKTNKTGGDKLITTDTLPSFQQYVPAAKAALESILNDPKKKEKYETLRTRLSLILTLLEQNKKSTMTDAIAGLKTLINEVIETAACGDPCALGNDVASEANFLADLAGASSIGHPIVITKPLPAKPSVVAVGAPVCSAAAVPPSGPVPLSMSAGGR